MGLFIFFSFLSYSFDRPTVSTQLDPSRPRRPSRDPVSRSTHPSWGGAGCDLGDPGDPSDPNDILTTLLTPMTKYALEFAPFAMQLEQSLPSSFKSRTRMIIRGTVGSILLLIILVLALSVTYFEHVLSLTGSLVSVGICITFPCAFYTRIFWRQISTPLMLFNIMLIAFGVTLGAFGTFSSSRSLIISLQRGHTS